MSAWPPSSFSEVNRQPQTLTTRFRSGKNIFTRPSPIDLSSARQYAHALDLDLDDEEAALNERRAMGGDRIAAAAAAVGNGRRRGPGGGADERPFLLDSDDDDD